MEGSRSFSFPSLPFPNLYIHSFGDITKKGQPNEGINPNNYPLKYIYLDDIIKTGSKYGQGALITKFDIDSAYCNLAVHPSNRYLIGMKWRSMFYVDLALPFGLGLISSTLYLMLTLWSGFF